MTKVTILTGSALTKGIKSFGTAAASFSEKLHQLAASALNHVEVHNCPSHLNNLYHQLPLNFRGALRVWACDLGKVTFSATPEVEGQSFAYAKGSKSDMDKALEVSPAAYQRDKGAEAAPKAFDEVKALETFLDKLLQNDASKGTIAAVKGALAVVKAPADAAKAAVAAAKLDKALTAAAPAAKGKAKAKAPAAANVEPAPIAAAPAAPVAVAA